MKLYSFAELGGDAKQAAIDACRWDFYDCMDLYEVECMEQELGLIRRSYRNTIHSWIEYRLRRDSILLHAYNLENKELLEKLSSCKEIRDYEGVEIALEDCRHDLQAGRGIYISNFLEYLAKWTNGRIDAEQDWVCSDEFVEGRLSLYKEQYLFFKNGQVAKKQF